MASAKHYQHCRRSSPCGDRLHPYRRSTAPRRAVTVGDQRQRAGRADRQTEGRLPSLSVVEPRWVAVKSTTNILSSETKVNPPPFTNAVTELAGELAVRVIARLVGGPTIEFEWIVTIPNAAGFDMSMIDSVATGCMLHRLAVFEGHLLVIAEDHQLRACRCRPQAKREHRSRNRTARKPEFAHNVLPDLRAYIGIRLNPTFPGFSCR